MSFTPNFSASQTTGVLGSLTLTDTSTGSDGSIASRRVYILTSTGAYLVQSGTVTNYESWAYADTSITLAVLDTDYAPTITVQWLDSGNTVLYTKSYNFCFDQYNKAFFYSLTQNQTSTPNIVNDTDYYTNKAILWTEIISAENAITYADDIYSAQAALDRASYLRTNQNIYF